MKKNSVSVYDISEALNISVATVSRVLNHPEQVRKETRDRVLLYMEKTGFQKRTYAVSKEELTSSSGTSQYRSAYLMSIPTATNPFYGDIIEGAMVAAAQHNSNIYIDYTVLNERSMPSFIRRVAAFRGLISLQPLTERNLHQILNQVPVVQCSEDAPEYPEVSTITIDNILAEKKAAEHLIANGCRSFSFFTSMIPFRFAEDRLQGLKLALEESLLSISANNIVRVSSMDYHTAFDAAIDHFKKTRPDAVVCISDVFAAACVNAARALSIRVPEDMMVLGFDNISDSMTTVPSITTIAQPRFQLGFHAFETLFREVHSVRQNKTHMILATELLIRQSTTLAVPLQ